MDFSRCDLMGVLRVTSVESRAELSKAGTPIGPYDLQIAAIALSHGLTLVTHNTKEFSRVKDLKLEDWET